MAAGAEGDAGLRQGAAVARWWNHARWRTTQL
jgi:hypothetical protein